MFIEDRSGFHSLAKAHEVAAAMQAGDEDLWTYRVTDCKNGLGRIDVYDEDDEIVVSGFIA